MFYNIDQKYFYLLVFKGKKTFMEESDQNRQRKGKKKNKDNMGRKRNYLLSVQ